MMVEAVFLKQNVESSYMWTDRLNLARGPSFENMALFLSLTMLMDVGGDFYPLTSLSM
jgi:hypothetical protein